MALKYKPVNQWWALLLASEAVVVSFARDQMTVVIVPAILRPSARAAVNLCHFEVTLHSIILLFWGYTSVSVGVSRS